MLVNATHATLSSTGDDPTIRIVSDDGSSVLLATSMYREIKTRRVTRLLDGTQLKEPKKFSVTVCYNKNAQSQ